MGWVCGWWWAGLVAVTLWAAIEDVRSGTLPIWGLLAALVIGLAGSPFCGSRGFFWSLGGVLWGGGLPLAAAVLFRAVTGREALGGGDVVLLACVGAYVGSAAVLLLLLAVCVAVLVAGAVMAPWRGRPRRVRLAPYVLAAVIFYLMVSLL
ncbi:MAG: prepilin peptidase [Proteobacteria bacterium]|nr:prepilin peptidase [Pseudomonadota bacterium]MBU1742574.1 prepilin peptidase [Pseudomonadota bacterium]